MLEIIPVLIGPAIDLGKSVAAPIKRQFIYICCYNSNIQSLKDEGENLDNAIARLKSQVEEATINAQVIFPEVGTWLKGAEEIQAKKCVIENEIPNLQSDCLTVKPRFLLSRKAKKTSETMKEIMYRYKSLDPISMSPSIIPIAQFESTYEFESRKHIEDDIMTSLRGKKVNMMGLCGMGGVGKTIMAKRIMNRAMNKNLFDEVVRVVVSQKVDILRIQHEIAELLGLKLKVQTIPARAHILHARLTGTRRTLIVLDDVWERFKLEYLGIFGSGFRGCTILLTSRDRGILRAMNTQKICEIQILPEREAWFLFREKAGLCVDNQSVLSLAQEVAKECRGLPIALVTVGSALQEKTNKSILEDALKQLKSCNPVDMLPDVIAEVYNPLKLSYDFLDNGHAKSLFLLCSLFPEDYDIPLEYLTFYGLGLRMFEGIWDLNEARNRGCTLVEKLKNHFLLLDGRDELHVKMQDVVRDVAIFTAKREGRVNLSSIDRLSEHKNCTWISVILKEKTELPMKLTFPSLRLLLIDNSEGIEFQMNDNFFQEMEQLNVLFLKSVSFGSLPKTIQLLVNLRTLVLYSSTLETISIVGKLLNLEIFSCRSCHSIGELPVEIGKLKRLKLLEFSNCTNMKTIAPRVISNLVQLEELKIVDSFNGWEIKKMGNEKKNPTLNELESLTNLTCLEIEIGNCSLAAENIFFSQKIARYDIRIYGKWPKKN